ncbi:MAG TPA: hypothetical protein VN628_20420 [Vicinamibacterales bacterium]|nr:hypothetical protein [Vicinamibacterales bacterium]
MRRPIAAAAFASVVIAAAGAFAGPLPAAQQTALVKKYCAVCHTDASKNGGISFQHYDAAIADAPLAAMILSKLRNGAMGAAGIGVPEPATRDAWTAATAAQAAGAEEWHVSRTPVLTASVVRTVPLPGTGDPGSRLYRLTLSCDAATSTPALQLTWSPIPQTDRTFYAMVDGGSAVPHTLAGKEKMGNGGSGTSGRASAMLDVPVPDKRLTITDLFEHETVEFPIGTLDRQTRRAIASCGTAAH